MTILWRALVAVAGLAAVTALAYTALSLQYRWGTMAQPGTGFFPFWVGVLLLAASLGVAYEAVTERPADIVEWPGRAGIVRVSSVAVVAVGYSILLVMIGHGIAASVAAWALMTVMGERRWWITVPIALFVGFGSAYLFADVLGVPLPPGMVFE